MRVAIIGGGISGLALAYYLQKQGVPYDLFEASEEVGGIIRTQLLNGYLLESGPNTLQMTDELLEMITDLKLEDAILHNTAPDDKSYVLHEGTYKALPSTPLSLRRNSIFSEEATNHILAERKVPAAMIPNETVTQFFERRFGTEITQTAINPLITGSLAGNPDELLLEKAFPELKELELRHGSVLQGLVDRFRNHKGKTFTFRQGMSMLPRAIAKKLISLHTEHQIEVVTRNQGKYIMCSSTYHELEEREYDAVVLALPAHQAADVMQFTFPGLAAALQNVRYQDMAVVHSVYNQQDVATSLDGFGAFNPGSGASFTTGAVWVSSLFRGRCKPHEVLLTSFVSSATTGGDPRLPDAELKLRVHDELRKNYGINSYPVYQHVVRWNQSIPQYDLYIEDAHQLASLHEQENIFVTSDWQGGITVADRIREAKELAQKLSLQTPMAQIA